MDHAHSETDLKAALTAFETSLTTPVVSGELAEWMAEIQQSWSEASGQIHYQLQHAHPQQYEEMSNADAELLPRVDQLRAEDEAIEQQREKLNDTIHRLAQHVPKLEPDEEKGQKHTKHLVDDGVAFVARVRKQEVAIETWYVEAFNRDRGAVD